MAFDRNYGILYSMSAECLVENGHWRQLTITMGIVYGSGLRIDIKGSYIHHYHPTLMYADASSFSFCGSQD
jgi:hypothetical protein